MNHMIVDVKGAVAIAMDYVKQVLELPAEEKLRLEETILQDDGHWLITVSHTFHDSSSGRSYKVIDVDAAAKTVRSMKIRNLDGIDIDGGVF